MRMGPEDSDETLGDDEVAPADWPWPPHADPRIITPEKIARAAKMSAEAQLHGAGLGTPSEYGPKDYTLLRYNPDDDTEVRNGVRFRLPTWGPLRGHDNRGGRVVTQRRRVRGSITGKTEVISTFRIHDPASTTLVRYDVEAGCEAFATNGCCYNFRHPHAVIHTGGRPTRSAPDTEEPRTIVL